MNATIFVIPGVDPGSMSVQVQIVPRADLLITLHSHHYVAHACYRINDEAGFPLGQVTTLTTSH